jgi:hypothetical protein
MHAPDIVSNEQTVRERLSRKLKSRKAFRLCGSRRILLTKSIALSYDFLMHLFSHW